jgi:hypothetical protein
MEGTAIHNFIQEIPALITIRTIWRFSQIDKFINPFLSRL